MCERMCGTHAITSASALSAALNYSAAQHYRSAALCVNVPLHISQLAVNNLIKYNNNMSSNHSIQLARLNSIEELLMYNII